MLARPPFVLLDDARPDGAPARLYADPIEIITAFDVTAIPAALGRVRTASKEGRYLAGFVAYEAAAAFEPALNPAVPSQPPMPLLWFGVFGSFEEIDRALLAARLPSAAGGWCSEAAPTLDRADYDARLARVIALIRAGDIYQANLTYPAELDVAGDPLALYARLRARAGAGYGACIETDDAAILSLSPELFFAREGDRLIAAPMKGTAARSDDPVIDGARAKALAEDPKQRAENLMIVDLLRNDLARVASAGSVAVPRLFAVETYPTVHQMVSHVTATPRPETDAVDVLSALFPCGSITGAPKIRAIEALADIEQAPRGLYTGAIGRIDPNGDAMFNVAIRTIVWPDGATRATIGLGGGITADSNADDEWRETLAKAAFLIDPGPGFDLIETMAFDPLEGLHRLEAHIARLRESARLFGFTFNRHAARNELQAATFRLRVPSKVRLMLAPSGAIAIEVTPMPPVPEGPVDVAVRPLPVDPRDLRVRHKTSDRDFYDGARKESGVFEVVFADPEGFLTEGSFTNIFVPRGDQLLTPPLRRGLLPGILRADLIAGGRAVEADLLPQDLEQGFFIGNALRGLIPARLVARGDTATL